jgi:hypothetical protein
VTAGVTASMAKRKDVQRVFVTREKRITIDVSTGP